MILNTPICFPGQGNKEGGGVSSNLLPRTEKQQRPGREEEGFLEHHRSSLSEVCSCVKHM